MTSPDQKADNSARNSAIKTVEDALKTGRIVQADHDMRVSQIKSAQTMQDVDMAVRDLRAVAPAAPMTIAPIAPTASGQVGSAAPQGVPGQSGQQWPLVNYGPGSGAAGLSSATTTTGKAGGRAIGGIIGAIILVSVIVPIVGAVIAFVAAKDSLPDFGSIGPTDETTYDPGQAPGKDGVNTFTVEGYDDLVAAIKKESNAGYVYSLVIYPRYAVAEIPTGTNNRYQNFYWDGETLELQDFKSTSTDNQVDASLVDPQTLIDCVTTVHDRMDSPESWYAVISDSFGSGAQLTCYATNDFGESTYIIENLDGTVTYDSELTVQPTPPAS